MNFFILDTNAELNKYYRNVFKKEYPGANVKFIYSAKSLLEEIEKLIPERPGEPEQELPPLSMETEPSQLKDSSFEEKTQGKSPEENEIKISEIDDTEEDEDIEILSFEDDLEDEEVIIINTDENNNFEQEPAPLVKEAISSAENIQTATIDVSEKKEDELIIEKDFEIPDTLVITETSIPDMQVFELIEKIKRKKIPIIIVSSESSERMVVECLRNGASDYLSKRNIKLGHFEDIISRAIYTSKKDITRDLKGDAKYQELNRKIMSSLLNEKSEAIRNRISRGIIPEDDTVLENGGTYYFIYLYVQLGFSKQAKSTMDSHRIKFLTDSYLNKFSEISGRYGHKFGLRKADGCFFGFLGNSYFQALVAAMEIHAQMNLYNITTENLNGEIFANIALSSGKTKYSNKIGNITCKALNHCAHMAMKAQINNGIMITKEIHDHIGERAEKYFKKSGKFENIQVYLYDTGILLKKNRKYSQVDSYKKSK